MKKTKAKQRKKGAPKGARSYAPRNAARQYMSGPAASQTYRGGSKPNRQKLYASEYLVGLLAPPKKNIANPGLGPGDYREFTLTTVFRAVCNGSKEFFMVVDPAQVGPITDTTGVGGGFLRVIKGSVFSPVTGTAIGEGQTYSTAGPYLADELVTRANSGYLNSASLTAIFIGASLEDGGTIEAAPIPQQDAGSTVTAPVFGSIANQPSGRSLSVKEGVSLVWLPEVWSEPCKVAIGDVADRSTPNAKSGGSIWYVSATTDTASSGFLEVTVVQNFAFYSNNVWFAGGQSGTSGLSQRSRHGALQHAVEKRAVISAMHNKEIAVTPAIGKDRHARSRGVMRFLGEAWKDVIRPTGKFMWNNRVGIGNLLHGIFGRGGGGAGQKLITSGGPIIEEIEEVGELAPLLLMA